MTEPLEAGEVVTPKPPNVECVKPLLLDVPLPPDAFHAPSAPSVKLLL
jgi:hypothetical protein